MDRYRHALLIRGMKDFAELCKMDRIIDIHRAQLLSYLKLGGYRMGYLLNFNVRLLKDGICRLANGL